ncbi:MULTISPECIES: response regulator transcription factor [Dehalobacter]|jgi:DNA-binding response OmpR family regulator|uniref:Stage 0 sporulation protein A homolog n=2 Tax=Dehalobacter restrictus TaxID=55583 RepID=A0A857DEI4_9FIRM|nr:MULTISPECIES: response regulator transcription factor [Dehalobacter]AHF09140.1 transcriptional regulator [Dehalobacter restrictus DSM 9455]MCG1024404.1 response regulator transcription factor [Dehalobacter sp.]MDJ0306880.1 response regulator transcription factor [Dehalobacter sp.]QGZ99679.1 response regulator [Dehalobacter restrictus]
MKKILIIEDDLNIAELQQDYLEVEGFAADICADGSAGLKQFQENGYDLLILDIMLPGLDGLEILRSLRDEKEVPVILVSAKKEEIDKIKGFNLGADDYITKPFSPGELVARVKAHLQNYEKLKKKFSEKQISNNAVVIRGLRIEKEARRVYIHNREANLAQKEFELLLYLAKHPNRVFGRDELFEKVWGLEALGDSATVTVHIARLRDKIESDPSNPQYIETVWGAGYRFRV